MIYQVTDDSLLIVACMSITMTTQLRQMLKASKLSIVLLANCPGEFIKPQEAHDGLRSQGRLEFLFNMDLFAYELREQGRLKVGRKLAMFLSNFS